MSSNQFLVDAVTRRKILVQRLANGNATTYLKELSRLRDEVILRIKQNASDLTLARYQLLLQDLNDILTDGYRSINDQIEIDIAQYSIAEAQFNKTLLETATIGAAVSTPTEALIKAAALRKPLRLVEGQGVTEITPIELISRFGSSKTSAVRNIVADGVLLGDASNTIIKNIRNEFNNIQSRHLRTLVKTLTNNATTEARVALFETNTGIIEGFEVVATLDGRTTLICAALDGQIFPLDDPRKPPFHHGCRTDLIPKIKRAYDSAEISGMRASKDGPVSAKTTYSGWLRKQPAAFQDEVLGPARAKLFRTGSIALSKFVDREGKKLTLERLKQLEPMVFEKANL